MTNFGPFVAGRLVELIWMLFNAVMIPLILVSYLVVRMRSEYALELQVDTKTPMYLDEMLGEVRGGGYDDDDDDDDDGSGIPY